MLRSDVVTWSDAVSINHLTRARIGKNWKSRHCSSLVTGLDVCGSHPAQISGDPDCLALRDDAHDLTATWRRP
jgi:hypothetical protein